MKIFTQQNIRIDEIISFIFQSETLDLELQLQLESQIGKDLM